MTKQQANQLSTQQVRIQSWHLFVSMSSSPPDGYDADVDDSAPGRKRQWGARLDDFKPRPASGGQRGLKDNIENALLISKETDQEKLACLKDFVARYERGVE